MRRSEFRAAPLDHPVVDIDGHCIEYFPGLAPATCARRASTSTGPIHAPAAPGRLRPRRRLVRAQRPRTGPALRIARPPWWGAPARNTRDLATALFPGLLYERLDELGIDVSVVYPSIGPRLPAPRGRADERRGACRALNRCNAEQFARLRRPADPGGRHPDAHARGGDRRARPRRRARSGFKAVLLRGLRAAPGRRRRRADPTLAPWARGSTCTASTAPTTTTRCGPGAASCGVVGGVPLRLDRLGQPASRPSNYMYNHIGHLAEGQHALCQVALPRRRDPPLPRAALRLPRGRRGVGGRALADLVGHWEKRNREALGPPRPGQHRPRPASSSWSASTAARRTDGIDPALGALRRAPRTRRTLDEFAALRHRAARGHRRAVRPAVLLRLRGRRPAGHAPPSTPRSTRSARGCRPMFGSDIAHWDVPDMSEVARGGVGDGRARADRRGRLPGLRVRQPGPLLHRRATRRSSRAPSSRPRSTLLAGAGRRAGQ